MDRLCRLIPPYASDYTGVASSLYDLNSMTVFCDAGCCCDHYVLNDEPRWKERQGLCFSMHLRSTEAILGADGTLIERICAVVNELDSPPPFVAVLGTPVPGILGMDMAGVASEVEQRLGIPALGFSTTGFKTYEHGIELAVKTFIERFGEKAGSPGASTSPAGRKLRVNIIGATPLDFGAVGNDLDFVRLFENAGWEVCLCLPMGATMGALAHAGDADVNLAVSAAGLKAARWLERRYGTPWVAGCPLGAPDGAINNAILDACKATAIGKRPSGWWRKEGPVTPGGIGPKTLVIADQVVGESLRVRLEEKDENARVTVASPFSWDATHAFSSDIYITSEEHLRNCAADLHCDAMVADPLLEWLASENNCRFVPLVHCAVSGKLHWNDVARLSEL